MYLKYMTLLKSDNLPLSQVGAETFRLCRELLDGVLLVDNRAISGAIEAVFNDKRSILEPAGAVAVAGAVHYLERRGIQVGCDVTGPETKHWPFKVIPMTHQPPFAESRRMNNLCRCPLVLSGSVLYHPRKRLNSCLDHLH